MGDEDDDGGVRRLIVVESTKDKYGSRIWLRWGSCGAVRCGAWSLVAGRWLLGRYADGQHLVDCHDIHCPGRGD
jgi:hypothetical protein